MLKIKIFLGEIDVFHKSGPAFGVYQFLFPDIFDFRKSAIELFWDVRVSDSKLVSILNKGHPLILAVFFEVRSKTGVALPHNSFVVKANLTTIHRNPIGDILLQLQLDDVGAISNQHLISTCLCLTLLQKRGKRI